MMADIHSSASNGISATEVFVPKKKYKIFAFMGLVLVNSKIVAIKESQFTEEEICH